jgi:hypothetical protein
MDDQLDYFQKRKFLKHTFKWNSIFVSLTELGCFMKNTAKNSQIFHNHGSNLLHFN